MVLFNLLDLSERRLWHMPLLQSFEDFRELLSLQNAYLSNAKGFVF